MIEKYKKKVQKALRYTKHCNHVLKAVADGKKHLYYFGAPMHPNLGDLAQCVCIRRFLRDSYPDCEVVEVDTTVFMRSYFPLRNGLKKRIKKDDLIICQSGYCTHDLGGQEDMMHQALMQDYPDNHIVILPQTVFFKSKEREEQCSRVYNGHKHLLFFARDMKSFEIAKRLFPDKKIYAYPDIVTTLIGSEPYASHKENRDGILLCIRNDVEKYYTDEQITHLRTELSQKSKVDLLDTTVGIPINADSDILEDYIRDYIFNMSKYRLIITDRFHGTIFGLVSNTPVIVIKTTDHKVSEGVNWFNGVYDTVQYVPDIKDVPQVAYEMMERYPEVHNEPYFKEQYYDKLKSVIDEFESGDTI